jgi:RNA polymerase sigma-70 factor (ECF subfamily)
MDENAWLALRFEEHRAHLRGVAFRMLGSMPDADDAVQEAWLRLSRADASEVENWRAWLTTVVARVCLNVLRSRESRREEALTPQLADVGASGSSAIGPEDEMMLADSVGVALLVVLDRLPPAQRLAFVLHDMFDVPFDEIARIVGCAPAAARQLASRARRRVRGAPASSRAGTAGQRQIVEAFVKAVRDGDLAALLAVLDPDAVLHIDVASRAGDPRAVEPDKPREIRGSEKWARQFIAMSRGLRSGGLALIDGSVGLIAAPHGKLFRVLAFSFANDRVSRIDVIGDPVRLREVEIAAL